MPSMLSVTGGVISLLSRTMKTFIAEPSEMWPFAIHRQDFVIAAQHRSRFISAEFDIRAGHLAACRDHVVSMPTPRGDRDVRVRIVLDIFLHRHYATC